MNNNVSYPHSLHIKLDTIQVAFLEGSNFGKLQTFNGRQILIWQNVGQVSLSMHIANEF